MRLSMIFRRRPSHSIPMLAMTDSAERSGSKNDLFCGRLLMTTRLLAAQAALLPKHGRGGRESHRGEGVEDSNRDSPRPPPLPAQSHYRASRDRVTSAERP